MREALNKEFNDTITKQQAQMDRTDNSLKALQDAYAETTQKITQLTGNVTRLSTQVDNISNTMNQMNATLQALLARSPPLTAPITLPATTAQQETSPTNTNTPAGNDGQVATGSDIGLPEPPAKRQSTTVDDAEFEDADEIAAPTAEQQQAMLQQGTSGTTTPPAGA